MPEGALLLEARLAAMAWPAQALQQVSPERLGAYAAPREHVVYVRRARYVALQQTGLAQRLPAHLALA